MSSELREKEKKNILFQILYIEWQENCNLKTYKIVGATTL